MERITSTLFILAIFSFSSFTAVELKAQSNWEAGIRFGIATYFDWLFAISDGPNGLKFYPGVGPEIYFGNNVDFDIAGNFGAEYRFDFPLTIGFDRRPGFRVTNDFKWKSSNWGYMARFRFGQGTKFVRTN